MPKPFANNKEQEAFFKKPRLAILMTNRAGEAPMGVPVWFEWTGEDVLMFAATDSPEVRRLRADPHVSVLVTNHIGEAEAWVAFDGVVDVVIGGASELIGRMGPRYWDLSDPEKQEMLAMWMAAGDAISLLRVKPTSIRSGA